MKDDLYNSMGHKCPPAVEDPARQPNPPNHEECASPVPPKQAPRPDAPAKCPEPDCCCHCPSPPGSTSNCLEKLIETQNDDITAADKAKFKAELVQILEKAKAAKELYTRELYDGLKATWIEQDAKIADMIRRLECSVRCWDCILECHICPLLYKLHAAEKWLYDDEKRYAAVNDLYDQQYWLEREHGARERKVKRIRDVIKVWESPKVSIETALKDNKKLIDTNDPLIGTQPGKVIYEIFFELVPRHLAIAPPADVAETKIDKRYTEFCDCGTWDPDDCCGPNVAVPGFRQRIIPPQAYLIKPDDYFDLMCCLIDKKFKPANDDLIDANLQLALLRSEIKRFEDAIGAGWQARLKAEANGAIPILPDCCEYEHKHDCDKEKSKYDGPKKEKEKGDEKKEEYPNGDDQAA